jgi:hypothetical protein
MQPASVRRNQTGPRSPELEVSTAVARIAIAQFGSERLRRRVHVRDDAQSRTATRRRTRRLSRPGARGPLLTVLSAISHGARIERGQCPDRVEIARIRCDTQRAFITYANDLMRRGLHRYAESILWCASELAGADGGRSRWDETAFIQERLGVCRYRLGLRAAAVANFASASVLASLDMMHVPGETPSLTARAREAKLRRIQRRASDYLEAIKRDERSAAARAGV